MRSVRAFVLGLGAAYLFDPKVGRRRRSVARARAAKFARRMSWLATRKARFAGGKARGVWARSRRAVSRRSAESADAVVEQRVRSEVFRDVDIVPSDVEFRVEDGVVTLTGVVASDKLATDLVGRIWNVTGVEDVAAMLRVVASEDGL